MTPIRLAPRSRSFNLRVARQSSFRALQQNRKRVNSILKRNSLSSNKPAAAPAAWYDDLLVLSVFVVVVSFFAFQIGNNVSMIRTKHSPISLHDNSTWSTILGSNNDGGANDEALHSFETIQKITSIYPLTVLIREARKGNLKDSETVLSFFGEEEESLGGGYSAATTIRRGRRRPMSTTDIVDIISSNYNHLQTVFGKEVPHWLDMFRDMDGRSKSRRDGYNKEESTTTITYEVLDFKSEETRFAYGIIVDKHQKSIDLIFRGSYDGTSDWTRNLQFRMTKMSGTGSNKDDAPPLPLVHQGYHEYLFNNSERDETKFPQQRYDEIINHLIRIQKANPGYQLVFGGHSMGGALATLMAYQISSSSSEEEERSLTMIASPESLPPITCVTIGSPQVGDQTFRDAYNRHLDNTNTKLMKHLRIENDNDLIPRALKLFDRRYKNVGGTTVQLRSLCNNTDDDYPNDNNGKRRRRFGGLFLKNLKCTLKKVRTGPIWAHHPIEYNRRAAAAFVQ